MNLRSDLQLHWCDCQAEETRLNFQCNMLSRPFLLSLQKNMTTVVVVVAKIINIFVVAANPDAGRCCCCKQASKQR